jgi:hypothetical protein
MTTSAKGDFERVLIGKDLDAPACPSIRESSLNIYRTTPTIAEKYH